MKKTLIVVSLLDGKGPTGVEAHFNQLLAEARAAGMEAVLAAAYPARRWWAAAARKLVPALRLVHVEYAEMFSFWINGVVLAGKLSTLLARSSGDVTVYAQDPVCARVALRVRQTLQQQQRRLCRVVTVVHYNASQAGELLASGGDGAGPLARYLLAAEAAALPGVDHLIFVSRFMQAHVAQRLPALRCVAQSVIPNFAARAVAAETGAPAPRAVADLIAIGTLEPRKNQAFLLRVLARATARGCRLTLTLVGDGPDRTMLTALAAQLRVQDQVRFAGFQQHAGRLIAQHRVLVHAAVLENLPITLIEALAAGRPILAPAVGGIPEIYRAGVEGYFWPLDDIDAAATVLIDLMGDPAGLDRLARAARERYRQHFACDLLLGRWLATLFDSPQAVAEAAP